MTSVTKERLCMVLELAEQMLEFYEEALMSCDDERVRDIFNRIQREKIRHHTYLTELVNSFTDESNLLDACAMLESETDSPLTAFEDIQKTFDQYGKCATTAWEALGNALTLELKGIRFYEGQLATAPEEDKPFYSRMVQEIKGQYVLLSDLQYYLDGAPTRTA